MFSSLWDSLQTTVGRVLGVVVSLALVVTLVLLVWRAVGPDLVGPAPEVPTSKPPVPPIFGDETVAVRPDSVGGWMIDPDIDAGDFDATLSIAFPDSAEADSLGAGGEGFVQIGIRERAPQFFPEFPGRPKLPVSARVIGGSGQARTMLVEQAQPVFDLELQSEFGVGYAPSAPARSGVTVGVTALRAYGTRIGAFAYAGAGSNGGSTFEIALRGGPYVSLRVYGLIGVGIGKDLLNRRALSGGWVGAITVDILSD